jgi:hypothetical protein
MSWVYTQADYEGIVDSDYAANVATWIADRRSRYANNLNPFRNNKLLIAGCGYGYLVAGLMADGFTDVWGCDASAWAIQQAQALHPAIAGRFVVADITVRQNLNALRAAAGLSGNQRFRAAVTEDVLPCAATEAEAQTMLTELRRITTDMAHLITMRFPDGTLQPDGSVTAPWSVEPVQMPGFLWRSPAEWIAIINNAGEPIHDQYGTVWQGPS